MLSKSDDGEKSSDYREERRIKMSKKKLLLRIDPKLHEELRKWADDEFRSINSQIEFLLKKSLDENRRSGAS